MEYVHDCFFCGWRREATSATVLSPSCEECGCAVRSAPRPQLEPLGDPVATNLSPSGIAAAARFAMALVMMVIAARAGYAEAGPAISLAAFGAAGLLSVPLLVPSK